MGQFLCLTELTLKKKVHCSPNGLCIYFETTLTISSSTRTGTAFVTCYEAETEKFLCFSVKHRSRSVKISKEKSLEISIATEGDAVPCSYTQNLTLGR